MRLLSDHGARLDVSFVSDLTLAGFEEMAAALDPDTILLILTVFEDAEGRTFIPRDAAAAIASASAAPAYGVYSSFIGTACRRRLRRELRVDRRDHGRAGD